ncbi:hypothetical protein ACKWTF_010234 [Chironomus riparius]
MPLFETVFQEKPAIVMEIGSAYTKIGFCGEAHPRFILPTEIESIRDVLKKTEKNLYDQSVDFFNKIFFDYLLVSPKDRKVSFVESTITTPTLIRESFAKVLFHHFEVASILFLPLHLVSLSTLAIDTALVVDIGYKEAVILPVFNGVQILKAWQAQPLGGESIHDGIKASLILNGVKDEILSERVIEDIKPCPDVDYPVDGSDVIKIPGNLREFALEVLFPEDNDYLGLPYIIIDAIIKCPVDSRKELAENILLIGGTSSMMGIKARLRDELRTLIKSEFYKDRLYIDDVKFHNAPSKPNFTGWLGGSIYSATDLISNSITRENYLKHPKIPDWIFYDGSSTRNQG